MKFFLFYLILTILVLSCKKEAKVQDVITTSKESQITNSNVTNGSVTPNIKIRVFWASQWVSFYQSCITGYWYCWEITNEQNAREYININDRNNLITFGIDNSINPDYNRNFINGSNFNFPEDTYIKKSIVNAAIGVDKEIIVKKGLYHFDNIDGILTISAPYTIVN